VPALTGDSPRRLTAFSRIFEMGETAEKAEKTPRITVLPVRGV
jgi:hypothetical protein